MYVLAVFQEDKCEGKCCFISSPKTDSRMLCSLFKQKTHIYSKNS